jgi:hypothetical protein
MTCSATILMAASMFVVAAPLHAQSCAIRHVGWQPETFASAQEFLSRLRMLVPTCLVLDVTLPGLNGLELQKHIAVERAHMPIIFITGHGDVGRVGVLLGYKFYHISNAGTASRNPGLDGHMLVVGLQRTPRYP